MVINIMVIIILLTLTWVEIKIFFDKEVATEYVGADFEIKC